MTFHVLGIGESLREYIGLALPNPNEIGVNDICTYLPCDKVVCIDAPTAFEPKRRRHVANCRPSVFYSHHRDWEKHPAYSYIALQHGFVSTESLKSGVLYASNNSPYVACQLAYQLGATEIVLWGVDFNTHVHLSGDVMYTKAKTDYERLAKALKELNIGLYVGSKQSRLSEVLPVWIS